MENHNNACDNQENERRSHHPVKIKNDLTSRLNKIEGQIRGIKGMIEKDTYCDDVLNQISAIQAALGSVGKILLEAHVKSCIIERIKSDELDAVDELMVTIKKLIR